MTTKRRAKTTKIPRQTRSRATVAAIVEAATRILEREGYAGTNVNHVAELAGVSVGSLYQYFPTKEALVGAVAQDLTAKMLAEFGKDLMPLATAPLPHAIRGIVERAIAAFRLNPRLRRVLRDEVPTSFPYMQTPEFDAALEQILVSYLDQQRALLRPRDPRLAVRILMCSVHAIADDLVREDGVDLETLTDEACDLVARYLLREPD